MVKAQKLVPAFSHSYVHAQHGKKSVLLPAFGEFPSYLHHLSAFTYWLHKSA